MPKQDHESFNGNVPGHQNEIKFALDDCESIVLVIAHDKEEVSQRAHAAVIKRRIDERVEMDERIADHYVNYGPKKIVPDLSDKQAVKAVGDFIARLLGR